RDVQAAINAARADLPSTLRTNPTSRKVNPADAPIVTLGLTSRTRTLAQIEDLADQRLAAKIAQMSGVGLVTLSGGQRPAVRIQANVQALASYGLSTETL
ncbi:efflux RND transporter permease subunit, partial [Escherichia coli]|uniref:efflux RND transporter permease subunit n=1 Tax=Escherichia coli TaxID=562 RepID=UPI0015BF47C1